MDEQLDTKYENSIIEDCAKDMYREILCHARRRQLEPDFVVNKFLAELRNLAKNDGFIK